jgi:hypothetical protein
MSYEEEGFEGAAIPGLFLNDALGSTVQNCEMVHSSATLRLKSELTLSLSH